MFYFNLVKGGLVKNAMILLILFFATISFAKEAPENWSPSQCRQYCGDNSGGCIDLNRPPTLISAGIFFRLLELASLPQQAVDESCGQSIVVETAHFSITGKSCKTNRFEASLIMPGNTTGSIAQDKDGFIVLTFNPGSGAPIWELNIFDDPIGANPVKFLTLENRQGIPRVIWFDGYWCYSVQKD
jgi:hypothetical protein